MGKGLIYVCKKCKKEFEFMEGRGMLDSKTELMKHDSKFNLIKRYKDGINGEKLNEIFKVKKHILDENYYGYKTYQCPKCKRITNKFYFKLIALDKNDEDFISEYKCSKCNEKMEIIENLSKCPICGKDFNIEDIEIMNWD